MRNYLEKRINELSEEVTDLSKYSNEELYTLLDDKIAASLNYMYSSGFNEGYDEGYRDGVESQKNT